MWIARFKVRHKQSAAVFTSGKDVQYYGYFLNSFYKGKKLYVNRIALISGNEAAYLIEKMKHEKWIEIKWIEGNTVLFSNEVSSSFHTLFSDGTVFFLKPIIVKNGFEYWEVASWEKKYIHALFKRVNKLGKKTATIELLELKNKPISNFFSLAHADLTTKQLKVLRKACSEGYYDIPRKISVEELADKINEPRTTLQDKLRRAEKAIIPSLVEEIDKDG
ncbi:MAG: helix-turn-helix domain-containing protein [Candidatus Micrarchaeota archaeon]|nr:helix-turn-helix domain-containing protein [Candidatus Micrarchaeota archaeon]